MFDNPQQLKSIYTIGYYSGLISTVVGCLAIYIKTQCTPKELLGRRYNHYYQEEISSFISYLMVVLVYLANNAVMYFSEGLHTAIDHWATSAFIVYMFKVLFELLLVVGIVISHKKSSIQHSLLTRIICLGSIFLAFWHFLRAFDYIVFETRLLDNCYSMVVVAVTVVVSGFMVAYAFLYAKTKAKEKYA
ncbi:hypothetical protein [Pseudoalteromonas sp. MTN2-4]|uniref:hypothetical protein n=1 Tax=Pseudoalteromonas sp. MTN2-4 TaxID=3056555 RepID=UPI0036F363F6